MMLGMENVETQQEIYPLSDCRRRNRRNKSAEVAAKPLHQLELHLNIPRFSGGDAWIPSLTWLTPNCESSSLSSPELSADPMDSLKSGRGFLLQNSPAPRLPRLDISSMNWVFLGQEDGNELFPFPNLAGRRLWMNVPRIRVTGVTVGQ